MLSPSVSISRQEGCIIMHMQLPKNRRKNCTIWITHHYRVVVSFIKEESMFWQSYVTNYVDMLCSEIAYTNSWYIGMQLAKYRRKNCTIWITHHYCVVVSFIKEESMFWQSYVTNYVDMLCSEIAYTNSWYIGMQLAKYRRKNCTIWITHHYRVVVSFIKEESMFWQSYVTNYVDMLCSEIAYTNSWYS